MPLLAYRVFSHKMIEKIYTAGFKSFKLCSSKDWILKQSDISRVSRTDMQMAQWMCNVSQRDRKSSTEFRNRLGVVNRCFASNKIGMVWACWRNGHPKISNCRFIAVDGQNGRGRPCKTWTSLSQAILRSWDYDHVSQKIQRPGKEPSRKTPSPWKYGNER